MVGWKYGTRTSAQLTSTAQTPVNEEATTKFIDPDGEDSEDEDRLREEVVDISNRARAPGLLLFGAAMDLVGFIIVTCIGIVNYFQDNQNETILRTYNSGMGYFPATVSEMVHDQSSPGGRIFHTFGMMSGLCVFLSWYPLHLRNVFTGKDMLCGVVYWNQIRQLVPAMGLLLLIGVNTYPSPVATHSKGKTKVLSVGLHLLGAFMMFMGYLVCEIRCLARCRCLGMHRNLALKAMEEKKNKDGLPSEPSEDGETTYEWHVRVLCVVIISASFAGFVGLQCLMFMNKDADKNSWFCCPDIWKMRGQAINMTENVGDEASEVLTILSDILSQAGAVNLTEAQKNALKAWRPRADLQNMTREQTVMDAAILWDTAKGNFFKLKVASFICEDIAGVFLVLSHLCIWYYCPERHAKWMNVALKDIHRCGGHHKGCKHDEKTA